jgi:predicted DCC family thiol-disulfide oxidoreductase YuxK
VTRYTVVYDGHCRVCTRIAHLLQRWDRDGVLEVVPSQAEGVRERFPWIAAQSYADSLQVVTPDGTTYERSEAVERIIDVLPRGRLVTWLFRLPLARPLFERFYRWFARNRYRLGCGDHCSYHPRRPPKR